MANLEKDKVGMTKVGIPRKKPERRLEPLIPQIQNPVREPQPIPIAEPIRKPEPVPVTR